MVKDFFVYRVSFTNFLRLTFDNKRLLLWVKYEVDLLLMSKLSDACGMSDSQKSVWITVCGYWS